MYNDDESLSLSQSETQSDEESLSEEYQVESKRITKDGATYSLFDDDSTAIIIECDADDETFEVPSSIEDDDDFYIIKAIGPRAFKHSKVKEITFRGDSSISSFGRDALFCSTLEIINFPFQLKKLEQGWCYFTLNLSNINVIEGNKHFIFEDGVLYNSAKTTLYFCSRKKRSIIIPSSVKIIGSYAFEQCRKLETVQFEDQSDLEVIEPWAFSRSHLRSITIPKTVKAIHCNAFYWCKRLRNLKFEEGSQLLEIHHAAFKETPLVEITLPDTTKMIGKNAFQNCSKLESLSVYHKGELKIEKSAFKNVNEDFVLQAHTETTFIGNGYEALNDKIHQFDDNYLKS